MSVCAYVCLMCLCVEDIRGTCPDPSKVVNQTADASIDQSTKKLNHQKILYNINGQFHPQMCEINIFLVFMRHEYEPFNMRGAVLYGWSFRVTIDDHL